MTEETVFTKALAKRDAEARAAFLNEACSGNPELRAAVDARLAVREATGHTLEPPATDGTSGASSQHGAAQPDPALEATSMPETDEELASVTVDHAGNLEAGTAVVIAGRYALQEKIGEGGMGEVWVAKQTEPVKRKVALKLIKPGMDSHTVLQRFEQERQALALMDHPNIARVLDGGLTPNGGPFFVMELVNGKPLTRFCDEAKLTPEERLELFVPICQAVQHAHQKGIVHRDLKPANILVSLVDSRPIPMIIDFGVAKATAGKLTDLTMSTQIGAIVGTLEYMSPEQADLSGTDIDTRSDIYSLGVILYELLTGLRPIDANRLKRAAITEMIRIILEEEPSKPSTRLSTEESLPSLAALRQTEPRRLMALLRGDLDWVVMKCLEKGRDRRYETANALGRDIQRYLADEPVEARPPSARYRFGKFLRRHKGAVIAATLVAMSLLSGLAVSLWQTKRAIAAERLALENEAAARASAAAETAANAQTKKRLSQIEKGVDLFAGMLKDIHPANETQGGPSLYEQLREKAEKAADELDGEAVGDPVAVAHLQRILGETLDGLGSATKAIAVLEKAVATDKAELGPEQDETLAAAMQLATAYQSDGRTEDSIKLFDATLKLRESKFGDDDTETLKVRVHLALAYKDAGRTDDAIRLLERALSQYESTIGPDHPNTVTARNNLAVAYAIVGRIPQAIPHFERSLKSMESKLGPEHHDSLVTRSSLAAAYARVGRAAEGIAMLEASLKHLESKLGPDHPHTLRTRNNLATTYQAAGRVADAVPLLEATAKQKDAKLGPDHPESLITRTNLGAAYQAIGRNTDAESVFRALLARQQGLVPANIPAIASTAARLGSNLLIQQKWAEAEPFLRDSLAVREKMEADVWTTFHTESMLGGALLGQKKYTDAEPYLLKGYEGLKKRQDTIPTQVKLHVPKAAERIVQLYEEMGKPDDVAKWRKEVEAVKAAQTSGKAKRP